VTTRASEATAGRHLAGRPDVPERLRSRLASDFDRFKRGLPADVAAHALETYQVDLSGEYAGRRIRVPFGKASGQLSMTAAEVEADVAAGLGFVVLKTVIGEDAAGRRTMDPWAVRASAMKVEPITSRAGKSGWTVTWKGRGWDRSFDEYLALYREALAVTAASGVPVAASVKCHLPHAGEPIREEEYGHTLARLSAVGGKGMIVEKDFSPTLAGDARAGSREAILRWIREVPALMKRSARMTLGLKLMNALHGDDLQVEMVRAAAASGADFLVLFNRLFDPKRGVAYGGWDLSDRNLRVLDGCRDAPRAPTFSATGNICSGRVMAEYALRGATSGQVHTLFQLPLSAYPASAGSRSVRALHALLFHPEEGLIAWMLSLGEAGLLQARDGSLHFLDIARGAARHTA
jgi:dihydroorotate dehydrogenase